MTKYTSLYIYALLLMVSGFVLLGLVESPYKLMTETFFIVILLTAAFAGITSFYCKPYQVPMNYHGMHAIGLLLYGISILMLTEDLEKFYVFTVFYLLYYGIAEIIFGLQMLLQKDKMIFRVVAIRLAIGFFIALTVVGLYISSGKYVNLINAIKMIGVLFILSGINLLFYKDVLKKLYQKENIITKADAIV
jgi:hypothetical protein